MSKKKQGKNKGIKDSVEKIINKLKKTFKKKSKHDGLIFLSKIGDEGVSLVDGNALCIEIMLMETALRDSSFKEILLKVSNMIKNDSIVNGLSKKDIIDSLRESGIDVPEGTSIFNLGEVNPNEMSDKDIDSLIDRIINDGKKDDE